MKVIETEKRIQCRRCKAYVKETNNFCTYCGLRLKETKLFGKEDPIFRASLRKKYVISFFLSFKWKVKLTPTIFSKFNFFVKEFDKLCNEYDGFLEKFNHFEGALVIFGHSEFERDLIYKVLDFSFKVEELLNRVFKDTCEYGIGICSGWSFFGEVETGNSMSVTALGDCVNTSARLSTLFNGRKYVCADIFESASRFYEFEYIGKIKLKGRFEKMDVYVLISEKKEIDEERFVVPYVPREDVEERINNIIKDWTEGNTRRIFITGEAGIGKTFLGENIINRLKNNSFVITLKGSEIYIHEPLHPFKEFAENSLNKREYRFIKKYLETFLRMMSSLNLGVDDRPSKERLKYLLFDLLRIISRKKNGLVIFFDDIDRCDDFTIEFINFIKSKIEKTLFIFTGRVSPTHFDTKDVFRVNLRPFEFEETKELIEKFFGRVEGEIVYEVHNKTGGIPLFISQYIKSLRIKKTDIREKPELPLSFISFVLSPIQNLTSEERDILEILSAITELDLESPLSKYYSIKIEGNLSSLILNDIVRIENNKVIFVNPLVREVIYESLPDRIKERIHNEVVDAVAGTSWAENNPYFVFINALRAKRYELAWEYGLRSLKKLLREGTGFIPNFIFEKIDEEVLKNYKVKPLQMGDYFYLKGIYSFLSKDFERSIHNFHKALLLAEEENEKWNEINLYLAKSYIERGNVESAKKFLRDIKIKDEIISARVNTAWAELYKKEGAFFDALIFMRRANNDLRKRGITLSVFKLRLSDLLFWTGNLEDALNSTLEAERSSFMEMNFENLIEAEKVKAFIGFIFSNENVFTSAVKTGLSFSQKFENLPYIFYFKNFKNIYKGKHISNSDINFNFLRDPYIFFSLILNDDEEFLKKVTNSDIADNPNFPFFQKIYIRSITEIQRSKKLSEDIKNLLEKIFKYPVPVVHLFIITQIIRYCKKIERYDIVKFLLRNYVYIFEDLKSRIKKSEFQKGFELNSYFNPEKILAGV